MRHINSKLIDAVKTNRSFKAIKLIIENGTNIDLKDNQSKTVLDYAKQTNFTDIIDLLENK